jgi:hypothetical protein
MHTAAKTHGWSSNRVGRIDAVYFGVLAGDRSAYERGLAMSAAWDLVETGITTLNRWRSADHDRPWPPACAGLADDSSAWLGGQRIARGLVGCWACEGCPCCR